MREVSAILIILVILTIPLFVQNPFVISIAVTAVTYSTLSVSWFFLDERAGWVSLSHSIPFGFAAYSLVIHPLLLLPAFLLCLTIFILVSFLGREKFVFSTFILTILIWYLSHYLTLNGGGGEEGFSFHSLPAMEAYVLSVFILILSLATVIVVSKSGTGLKIAAVRDDEIAARSVGIRSFRMRVLAFMLSISIAFLAGICYILYFGHVSPEVFSVEITLLPFIASLIAGRNWTSPVVGSYAVVIVSRALGGVLPTAHLLLYAAVLILSPRLRRWWNAESY